MEMLTVGGNGGFCWVLGTDVAFKRMWHRAEHGNGCLRLDESGKVS